MAEQDITIDVFIDSTLSVCDFTSSLALLPNRVKTKSLYILNKIYYYIPGYDEAMATAVTVDTRTNGG